MLKSKCFMEPFAFRNTSAGCNLDRDIGKRRKEQCLCSHVIFFFHFLFLVHSLFLILLPFLACEIFKLNILVEFQQTDAGHLFS
jgi:hypothetical protein